KTTRQSQLAALAAMILLPAFASVPKADLSDGALFRETFKEFQPPWLTIDRHRKVLGYTTNGIDGRILQVTYIPSSQGPHPVGQPGGAEGRRGVAGALRAAPAPLAHDSPPPQAAGLHTHRH